MLPYVLTVPRAAAAQAWNVFDFVLILVGALALYAESPPT